MSTINSALIRNVLGLALCLIAPIAAALPPGAGLTIEGTAVTTFHSIGLYWTPHAPGNSTLVPTDVKIRYAKLADSAWKDGHDMWYDGRALAGRPREARGSVVQLEPGTQYIVQFGLPQPAPQPTQWVAEIRPTTWSETFPIGVRADSETWSGTKTTFTTSTFPAGGSRSGNARRHILLINQSGTASGYRLYDFTGKNAVGKPLQVDQNGVPFNNAADFCVVISADYVIVRGLRCIGGGEASMWIDPGHHDIVIEDVNLSDWAQKWADPTTAPRVQILDPETNPTGATGLRGVVEGEAGIAIQPDAHAYGSAPTSRVTVQRSKIHHPLYGSNSWEFGHPTGPTGILMYPTGGNHVIRYNEFYSTKNKADGSDGDYTDAPDYLRFFEDVAVLGGTNFDNVGSPGPDTDIYQNIIMHGMDDGLEAEGGGMNVRVWGNYFDYTATGPASTSVTLGPLYLFRNVYNRSRSRYNNPWGQENDRLGFFKAGSDSIFGGGRRYIYHNTALQYPNPHFTAGDCTTSNPIHCPLGMDYGISNADTDNGTVGVTNTVSLNNILEGWKNWHTTINVGAGGNNSFDYDMANTDAAHFGVTEQNWKIGSLAQYASGNGPLAVWTGKYRLQPNTNTSGYRDGFPIANFSDGFQGAKPDRGAHESTAGDMLFGLAAAGIAAPDLVDASDSGASNTDNVTNANTLTFAGSASAGSMVQILDGATVVGSGTAAADGTYSITTSVLADGSHIITAKVGAAQSQPLTVTVDTQAPASATITAPTNGSTVSGPVTISATTDATGVFGVQFKLNGNVLNAEDTSSPYSTSWDTTTVADGTYSLTATARDAAGNSVTSSAVSVVVSNGGPILTPPSIPDLDAATDSGTSNTDNITRVTLPRFTGTATAGTTVNIYSDGVQVGSGTVTNGAYSITVTTALPEGTRSITAKATNGTTTSAASGALSVAVDVTGPAVAISAPASSAAVSGTVPVNATATDANGVVGVQFQLDGAALQAEDTTSPYSISWDTTTATNGSHTLTAVGRDVAGNIVTSSAVTVTVSNGTNPELNVMVSPQNGTVSTATGEHLDVTVSAGVGLSSVNFYINNVLKASVTAAPFTFSWVTATENPGNYTLKVEATSGSGTLTETRAVTVLGTPCEIYANPQSVPQGSLLMLQGLCSGSKNVAEIQFSVDGITQSSDPSSSYTATLDTSRLAVGTRVVEATGKFTSPAGESSISRTVNVTQPVLSVDLMPGPVVLYDEKITFTASVNDGRQVKQIDFYLDGVFKAGTIVAPYAFTWTPSGIADLGRHTMAVYATDVSGNVVVTTRDVLLTPHTCSVELGTSRYRQSGADTVYAGPHRVAQGQRISVRSECSAWVSINRVEFYVNGVLQSSLPDAPYAWSIDTSGLTVGQTYTVSTKGYLTNGLVSNDAVTVQIVAP